MKLKYTIGITFDKGINEKGEITYYRDSHNLRKPYLFNLPNTDGNLIDSKCLGIMFDFCNTLAEGNEDPIVLEVILADEYEDNKEYIYLNDIIKGNYTSFPNYNGEIGHGGEHPLYLNLGFLYSNIKLKHIYIKKRKDVYLKVPTEFSPYRLG